MGRTSKLLFTIGAVAAFAFPFTAGVPAVRSVAQNATRIAAQSRYALSEESVVFHKNKGEEFKLLVLPDLQLEENDRADGEWAKTENMVTALIRENEPDLLVLLGDLVWENATEKTVRDQTAFLDGFQIPWAPVFGNHEGDSQMQALTGLTQEKIMSVWQSSTYCIFREGPQSVSGNGNYAVNLVDVWQENGKEVESLDWSFILTDSHSYDVEKGYDHLKRDQIEWYADYIEKLTVVSNKGKAEAEWQIPKSMLFMHIALPEYVRAYDLWVDGGKDPETGYGTRTGTGTEARVNTGMFNQILYSGSTTDVFAGHQHKNDFGVYYQGVWLRYALKTGPCLAGADMQGGTLVTIHGDNTRTVQNIYKNP